MLKEVIEELFVKMMAHYIEFVYKTSKVTPVGYTNHLSEEDPEKAVFAFWHGDSYSLFPSLKGWKFFIVTTISRRGDYISKVCDYFGYRSIRVPDSSEGGNYLFEIKKTVKENKDYHLGIALDGPLGPNHVPKDFPIFLAYMTRRRIIPLSLQAKREITIKKRWDNLKIPLPYNDLKLIYGGPLEVTKADREEGFIGIKNKIKTMMEHPSFNLDQSKINVPEDERGLDPQTSINPFL